MTIEMARQGVKELIEEDYGFDAIRIYLNDLLRGKDITKEEHKTLMLELLNGETIFCGFGTF